MVEVLKLGKIIFHDVTSKVIIVDLVTRVLEKGTPTSNKIKCLNTQIIIVLTKDFHIDLIYVWNKFEWMANDENQDDSNQHTSHCNIPEAKKKQNEENNFV